MCIRDRAIGVAMGAIFSAFLDDLITKSQKTEISVKQGFLKTGILLGLSIAMHNFPEGLAIGSGFVAETRLGISLAIVIALHNVPEGIAMVIPMKIGGYGALKAFLIALLVGVPMGVGAYFGVLIGEMAYGFIGVCLAFAGGTMLYITIGELIPKGKELDQGRISTMFAVVGFILGIIISKRF
jgi:ZIP family zinc transporter